MGGRRWTEPELHRLEYVWSSNGDLYKLAKELGRSVRTIASIANLRGFPPRQGRTILQLSRQLGYCRETIKRVARRLGFATRRNGRRKGSWWALSEGQVQRLIRELQATRTVRR